LLKQPDFAVLKGCSLVVRCRTTPGPALIDIFAQIPISGPTYQYNQKKPKMGKFINERGKNSAQHALSIFLSQKESFLKEKPNKQCINTLTLIPNLPVLRSKRRSLILRIRGGYKSMKVPIFEIRKEQLKPL